MRAVQVRQTGGPEVLELADLPEPKAGEGELLVAVAAAGVNYIDTYQRSGMYPLQTPFVLGMEGAGTVREVGTGVDGLSVGDRVAWCDTMGSYAEQAVVPVSDAVVVPDGVPDDVAGGMLLQGITAHYLVTDTYSVQPGDTVLVHAAAGGVGQLLTQLVTAGGGRVIGTVSTEAKEELAREAGAADVIRYTETDDLPAEVRERTGDKGVDVVYDGVGASTFDASMASLRRRGTLVLYGASSGAVPPMDPQRLNAAGSLYLTRPKLKDYIATREELESRAAAVLAAVADGSLRLRISERYPLEDARTAHEDLQSRRTTGKLLLIP
ncbi:MAG: quinone oxidoreductase [Pseudonocardiales bacterium]|nr:quinone oxidoreductase [Pseudonocardiales bacterium]